MPVEKLLRIGNKYGLHARPAMMFADLANKFRSDIRLTRGPLTVDGKSIMHMAMLAAAAGTKLKIKAEGNDAKAATDALKELVEDRMFDEPAWLPKE